MRTKLKKGSKSINVWEFKDSLPTDKTQMESLACQIETFLNDSTNSKGLDNEFQFVPGFELVDIKYQTSVINNQLYSSALVIYKMEISEEWPTQ